MMRKDYRADYYCEDNRTVGYNETFEQAYKTCADLGLEISFFPGIFKSQKSKEVKGLSSDIEKDDLPEPFIDRLEHVDERGLVGSIQLWTGARRNSETSFIYKGQNFIYFVCQS